MFDDLVTSSDKYKPYERDYRHKCPYCGSYNIDKGNMVSGLDDTWSQKCECNSCNRKWKFRYSADFSRVNARLERPNKYKVF